MEKQKTGDEKARHVEQWRNSGMTAEAYATREEINVHTLKNWAQKLKRNGDTRPGQFVEVVTPSAMVVAATEWKARELEVVLRNGVAVRVPKNFDAELLRDVVAVLEVR